MAFLSSVQQLALRDAFRESGIKLHFNSDHIALQTAQTITREKIIELVGKAKLCAIVPMDKVDGHYVFTTVPCGLPKLYLNSIQSFYREENEELSLLCTEQESSGELHFEKSKEAILFAAEHVIKKENAVLLGAARVQDIPLRELCEQFEKVTMVDIDEQTLLETLRQLPTHLQTKVKPLRMDLTGLLLPIVQKIKNLDPNLSSDSYMAAVTRSINEAIVERKRPDLPEKYDFAVSSMVSVQLCDSLVKYVHSGMQKKIPSIGDVNVFIDKEFKDSTEVAYGQVLVQLKLIQVVHLEDLCNWVLDEGKIYYADHLDMQFINIEFQTVERDGKKTLLEVGKLEPGHPLLQIESMKMALTDLFTSFREEESWNWMTQPPQIKFDPYPYCEERGNLMRVTAFYLQPKK